MAKRNHYDIRMASAIQQVDDPYLIATFSSERCIDGAYRGWYHGSAYEGSSMLRHEENEAVIDCIHISDWNSLIMSLSDSWTLRVERDALLSETYGNSFLFFNTDGEFIFYTSKYCSSKCESLKHIFEIFSEHADAAACAVLNSRYPVISLFHKPD